MLNYLVLALAGSSMVAAAPAANMTESYAMKMGIIQRSEMPNMNATRRDLGGMNMTGIYSRQVTNGPGGLNLTGTTDEVSDTLGGDVAGDATGGLTDDVTDTLDDTTGGLTDGLTDDVTDTVDDATGELTDGGLDGGLGGVGGDLGLGGVTDDLGLPGDGGSLSDMLDGAIGPAAGGPLREAEKAAMTAEEAKALDEVESTMRKVRDELRAIGM